MYTLHITHDLFRIFPRRLLSNFTNVPKELPLVFVMPGKAIAVMKGGEGFHRC